MDLKNLRIFARVAALQNLSGVAQEMDVAAGTISKRIQALEDEVGARLIDRTTRSSRLTEEGQKFLVRAERILSELDLARDEISANACSPAGRISLSAPACLATQLINPALIGFVKAYPMVDVRVDISDQIANLHEQGYDAAIRTGTLPDSTLKAKRLVSDRIVLVASPTYVAAHGAPQRASDLEHHACLVQGDQRNWTLRRGEEEETVRVKGRLASDSGEFLHHAALEGLGILRASQIAVGDDIADGKLLPLLTDYDLASDAGIWVVYPNNKHPLPRLRVFIDYLADFCRDRGYGASRRAILKAQAIYARGPQGDTADGEKNSPERAAQRSTKGGDKPNALG